MDIASFNKNPNQRSDISSLYAMKYIVLNKRSKISFEIYEKTVWIFNSFKSDLLLYRNIVERLIS